MKKTICFLLAAVFALGMAGCGAGKTPGPAPQAPSAAQAPEQTSSAAQAPEQTSSAAQTPEQTSSAAQAPGQPAASKPQQPPAEPGEKTEYRAMWVSYLEWENFDFSSEGAFRAGADEMMENCASLGLDTVIAQVRPFGDALYKSAYFPWSHLCTGTQGQDPGFDPLKNLVESAHAHGLRLEAWVNPYRIRLNAGRPAGELAPENPVNRHPEWAKQVAEGVYLDPASEEVRRYVASGVAEIVQNYEVDGIHFDDYFYPTTDPSFDQSDYDPAKGSLEDWRRQNVNDLMRMCYAAVKDVRPGCGFGVSPQGNIENNYNGQYSDVGLWLKTPGYVDYVMPQIYWGPGYATKSGNTRWAYENITAEWAALERAPSVQLYFGLGAYRIGEGDGGWDAQNPARWQTGHALADQVTASRGLADGWALYRYDFLFRNSQWAELAQSECEALKAANAQS